MVYNYCFENEKIQDLIVLLGIKADENYICRKNAERNKDNL